MLSSSPFYVMVSGEPSGSDVITNLWWQNDLQTSKIYHTSTTGFKGDNSRPCVRLLMINECQQSISRRKDLIEHHPRRDVTSICQILCSPRRLLQCFIHVKCLATESMSLNFFEIPTPSIAPGVGTRLGLGVGMGWGHQWQSLDNQIRQCNWSIALLTDRWAELQV